MKKSLFLAVAFATYSINSFAQEKITKIESAQELSPAVDVAMRPESDNQPVEVKSSKSFRKSEKKVSAATVSAVESPAVKEVLKNFEEKKKSIQMNEALKASEKEEMLGLLEKEKQIALKNAMGEAAYKQYNGNSPKPSIKTTKTKTAAKS